MRPVYIYARWSSLEQVKGSTLTRQIENCSAYVAGQGWKLASPPIIDSGRSAYTGDNIRDGRLGTFHDDVVAGSIRRPILVVEELDRLSRQPADVMLTWLSPLVRAGADIVVTQTNQVINESMLNSDMGGLMNLLVVAFGSYTESRKESERVAAAWEVKRNAARAGQPVTLNHRHPKWVTIEDGAFAVIPDREMVLRQVFAWAGEGLGKGLIAKRLNEIAQTNPAYLPWEVKMWAPTYIGRILRNRAVVGEWQPHNWARKDARRTIAGEAVEGYYPRVIDDATFALANSSRRAGALVEQGRGIGLSNLIGRKARCASCGGQMAALGSARYRIGKDGTKTRHYYLYCEAAKRGKGCSNQMGWPYDRIEGPLLERLLSLVLDDSHFAADERHLRLLEADMYASRERVAKIGRSIQSVIALVEGSDSGDFDHFTRDRYNTLRADLTSAEAAAATAEEAYHSAKGAVSPAEHMRRVAEVQALLDHDDPDLVFDARRRVKAALQDVIDEITFDPASGRATVRLIEGIAFFWIERNGAMSAHFDLSKERSIDALPPDRRALVTGFRQRRAATGYDRSKG
ncbi:DNA invertase Pin-like site-specific DNA recombinase [Novosphingobium sp. PhB55]|nr:recombinase family protein [Novosphingobium sp. PhB55]TDW63604.1 DNA invertase Pin-like site-specific DNA recombinase [Novosphingobium sp. PhB55]